MKYLVIACSVMKHELLKFESDEISFVFLEQGLHNAPEKLKEAIQEEINKTAQREETIVLGYGLCGNGIVGLKSDHRHVVIPRVHDCVALFLGSREKYDEEHKKEPGTYYLTRGWIEEKDSPLGNFEKYCQRLGKEKAEWGIREEFKSYTRIAFVHTGIQVSEAHREHAIENAKFLSLKYEEIKGSLAFFEKMFQGSWGRDFVILRPGEEATQELFLDFSEEPRERTRKSRREEKKSQILSRKEKTDINP
jgi:hypothetical protein